MKKLKKYKFDEKNFRNLLIFGKSKNYFGLLIWSQQKKFFIKYFSFALIFYLILLLLLFTSFVLNIKSPDMKQLN